MNEKFQSFQRYDESSFNEVQNVTHHATSVTDSFLHFECRAPGGSVLISDPVLETRLKLQF